MEFWLIIKFNGLNWLGLREKIQYLGQHTSSIEQGKLGCLSYQTRVQSIQSQVSCDRERWSWPWRQANANTQMQYRPSRPRSSSNRRVWMPSKLLPNLRSQHNPCIRITDATLSPNNHPHVLQSPQPIKDQIHCRSLSSRVAPNERRCPRWLHRGDC